MAWEKVKLGDICESVSDGDHLPPPKSVDGIPFVTISNVNSSNQFDFKNTMFVPHEYYEKLDEKRKPRINDILYSIVGSFGIPVFIKESRPFVFQRHIAILRPDESRIHPRYLYYKMLSKDFYMKADAVAIGAAQRTISLASLRNMEISIPCIDSQKRIADILSAYDDLIENNQKQIKLLEEAAQRLYKQWFIDLRFPGHETTKIVDGIPQGWSVKTVDDIAEYINGYAFKPSDWQTKGYPIIKIKEMNEGVTADTPRNSGETISPKYVIGSGDIVFSWSATLAAIIWDGETGLLNQHLFKVIPHKDFSREFVLQTIKNTLEEFQNLTTGSTMKHIQRGKLKEVKVNTPTSNIMKEFEKITEPIRNQILNKKKQILDLIQSRDRLLPKLMNGEL